MSVVIVSTGDRGDLQRALGIAAMSVPPGCELIVVRSEPMMEDMRSMILRCGAVFVHVPASGNATGLRERGLLEASGDVVVLREDREILDGGWLQRWGRADRAQDAEVPLPVATEAGRRAVNAEFPRPGAIAASG
ncbi:MAG TPA: hypothetical protein VLE53_02905 [Gemmatimonadaceae bacterium]|nr:hypothetical protein [Gemmatimonadaceae bacterium]